MITFKCKMCGGDLEFEQGATVAECPYCGSKQTLPKLDNDKRANMYDRANHFRRQNEYDKAMAIYEQILQEDRTDAEAYWSLVLCRYGIEYVEDPGSRKRIPTVNRVQYASILADEDYQSALQYADSVQRSVYEAEANAIAEIQKGILDISKQEKPFDIFICYKETDANGRRTPDSVLANDLYHQLTNEGFKVFFSRITLEDKLGTAYEPYIFAALNSAKVMVVLGTKPEYFNAVWVKNEWSRYLALIRAGADKVLVPAYRDMDPYDLPDEFAHLQAQDMGKLGFMQDLIRGIKKITTHNEEKPQPAIQPRTASNGATIESLMKRAKLFMEDGDFSSANEYLDKVLDIDPEYAPAYVGKVQASYGLKTEETLGRLLVSYENNSDWQKALRFATPSQRHKYNEYVASAQRCQIEKKKEDAYNEAQLLLKNAKDENDYWRACSIFDSLQEYRDSYEQSEKVRQVIDRLNYEKKLKAEKQRRELEEKQKEEIERINKKKKIISIFAIILAIIVVIITMYLIVIKPHIDYSKADSAFAAEDYITAYELYSSINKDKEVYAVKEKAYEKATVAINRNDVSSAAKMFLVAAGYKDATERCISLADNITVADLRQLLVKAINYQNYKPDGAQAERIWKALITNYLVGKWQTKHHSYKSYENKTVTYNNTWIVSSSSTKNILSIFAETTEKYSNRYFNFDWVESISFNPENLIKNGDILKCNITRKASGITGDFSYTIWIEFNVNEATMKIYCNNSDFGLCNFTLEAYKI